MSEEAPPWPDPTKDSTGASLPASEAKRLRRVLFRARVAEAATLREAHEKKSSAPPAKKAPPAGSAERRTAEIAADVELYKHYHQSIAEVAKASIDRVRSGVEFVEKAAAAILAIYTAMLGLVFTAGDDPLPAHGVIPGVFLAGSIAFAAAYLAFIRKTDPPDPRKTTLLRTLNEDYRTAHFVRWVRGTTQNKRYAAQAAVFFLILGALFMPVAFISFPNEGDVVVAVERVASAEVILEDLGSEVPEVPAGLADQPVELQTIGYQTVLTEYAAQLTDARTELTAAREALGSISAEVEAQPSWLDRSTIWWAALAGLVIGFAGPFPVRWFEER